ncbi:RNA polymerase sigma factor [Brumimicrobium mesophilum]|uniref:RNA polymerase sigma factor n=1 Tax=Brumimicrobium mesophilum TaxID=392717 RepID=UPI000D14162B|nr:RNA polymerase sigma factor [Brumimicrobium mesophilum]
MNDYQKKFLALYEPVHESFARFCHAKAYGLMEAEDLISETVLVALEKFDKIKNDEAFLSFLFSVATNILRSKNRRLKFRAEYNESEAFALKNEGIDAETRLDVVILYKALNELPETQKESLILFEISGFSLKEIAEMQNANLSAVKQRLKRGRVALADILNSEKLLNEPAYKRSKLLLTIFL